MFIGIMVPGEYGGVIIHDCWASYFSYKHCGHALCGSHLMRELTFVVESNGYAWAKNIKRLLQETCKKVSKNKQKKLSDKDCWMILTKVKPKIRFSHLKLLKF